MDQVSDTLKYTYLPPSNAWGRSSGKCAFTYPNVQPLTVSLCRLSDNAPSVRLSVQAQTSNNTESRRFPQVVRVNLAGWKLGSVGDTPALPNRTAKFPELQLQRVVDVHAAEATYKLGIDMPKSEDIYDGLLFSIAFGTDFLNPVQSNLPTALQHNPLCIDDESIKLNADAIALQAMIRTCIDKMRTNLELRNGMRNGKRNTTSLSFLLEALVPQCFDGLDLDTREKDNIQSLRMILLDELYPILLTLGITKVATSRSQDIIGHKRVGGALLHNTAWIENMVTFRASLGEFEKELLNFQALPTPANPLKHIVDRVSLFAHMTYMMHYMQGAQGVCELLGKTGTMTLRGGDIIRLGSRLRHDATLHSFRVQ